MSLAAGTRLGPYEILSPLGAGGMGEVYRARDTKLNRDVAIKILPDAFAGDPQRLARFQREAQVLASLNHANIAQIYGFEDATGVHALAMELVPGRTLADLIPAGGLTLAEALPIARQIAEALVAAHDAGVIHRDLKPANIKVRDDGTVKVLDFGLAKAPHGEDATSAADAPTLTSPALLTHQGVILGTAAYMAPEQARGNPVDKRADIWAFGVLLYEMLTGRRPFNGDQITDVLAAVVRDAPDMTGVPPQARRLIEKCLEKDLRKRLRDLADAWELIAEGAAAPMPARASGGRATAMWAAVVALIASALTAGAMIAWRPRPQAPLPVHFAITLPKDRSFTRVGRPMLDISPDGQNIVYVANNQLYLRTLAETMPRPIAGSQQDVSMPVFSPDGRWIAFVDQSGTLYKIPTAGGVPMKLARLSFAFGADWYADDAILVGLGPEGIVEVSAHGSGVKTVIPLAGAGHARTPRMLPDRKAVLFTQIVGDKIQIVTQAIGASTRNVIVDEGVDARYLDTGHLMYWVRGTAFAVPFDVARLQVTGQPVSIAEGVANSPWFAAWAVSKNGSVAAIPGAGLSESRALAVVQPTGMKWLDLAQASYSYPALSPDGKQLAVVQNTDIWIYDLAAKTALRRLTFSGGRDPQWTPDGKRIVFAGPAGGGKDAVYWQMADGSAPAERLTSAESRALSPHSVSPDGIISLQGEPDATLWMVRLSGDHTPAPLVPAQRADYEKFSPDGKWVAYQSGESGRTDVFVQPFPPTGAKYVISPEGGGMPVWARDGQRLFYVTTSSTGSSRLMSVDVHTRTGFTFSAPVPTGIEGFISNIGYDVMPDGRQFLMVFPRRGDSAPEKPVEIDVVLNWFTELAKIGKR